MSEFADEVCFVFGSQAGVDVGDACFVGPASGVLRGA